MCGCGGWGGYDFIEEKEELTGVRYWEELDRKRRKDARGERRNIVLLMLALAALAVRIVWLYLSGW